METKMQNIEKTIAWLDNRQITQGEIVDAVVKAMNDKVKKSSASVAVSQFLRHGVVTGSVLVALRELGCPVECLPARMKPIIGPEHGESQST